MGVSKNLGGGHPKSSKLIEFSIINHPFWEYPYFWKHPYKSIEFFEGAPVSSRSYQRNLHDFGGGSINQIGREVSH